MTSQEEPQTYADRCYRSPAGIAGGVVLLALGAWLGVDVLLNGSGRDIALALSGLAVGVPVVVAFTLRPAVFAGERRLRVRNPFRTIVLPWPAVDAVRSGYSSEVLAGGRTYQLWSIPVSLRARKKAARRNERLSRGEQPAPGRRTLLGGPPLAGLAESGEQRAPSDQVIDELRELAERYGEGAEPEAAGDAADGIAVRWAYEILAPVAAGAIGLAVLVGLG
ncbi:PH domain-containing protein [Streptomyces sp. AJS327]|uniref:PH domain-containing protein n=1 Tax=Streptomyces sp. AJS327 TaxID=2545265 RepID=UPI0015DD9D4A|nr:PH domain-containing protein [Streptomyces sp. AJS327]MBA0054210.1 PH domain-containing protein [Streptomyces sp. AJS327]